jgi:nucleolar protein 56
MKACIAKNMLGVFAFDSKGKLIDRVLFPAEPEKIAERLSGRSREEGMLLKKLVGYEIDASPGNPAEEILREQSRQLALRFKWVKSRAEYNQILSKVNVLLTKEKLRTPKRDRIIIHVVGVLDELDRVLNVFIERLREWYGLYFPEAERAVQNHERFAGIVSQGRRENIKDKKISGLAEKSAGMEFSDNDIKEMQGFSGSILDMFRVKKSVTKYLEMATGKEIPNLSAIAGPVLSARLLSLAGGLEKMAKMSSSTIQILGAEKSLFRHLKGGGRSPKYGVLYAHPYVQKAPKDKKGKVARLVAAKLSLAARIDFFSKKDRGKELKKDLEKQVRGVIG